MLFQTKRIQTTPKMESDDYFSTPESTPTQPKHKSRAPRISSGNPSGGLATPPTTQTSAGGIVPGGGSVASQPSGPLLHFHHTHTGPETAHARPLDPGPLVPVVPHDPLNPPTTPPRTRYGRGELSPTDRDVNMGENNTNYAQNRVSNALHGDLNLEERYREEAARKREEAKRKRAPEDVGAPKQSPKSKKPAGGAPGPLQRKIMELEQQLAVRYVQTCLMLNCKFLSD